MSNWLTKIFARHKDKGAQNDNRKVTVQRTRAKRPASPAPGANRRTSSSDDSWTWSSGGYDGGSSGGFDGGGSCGGDGGGGGDCGGGD